MSRTLGRGSRALTALVALSAAGCTWLPREFNLSPVYRQRLAADGTLLELDVLWPLIHYERTPDGGDDFRVRPFYRRVTEPETATAVGLPAVEHQFLWPLGRVRSDEQRFAARLFPLWWFQAAPNADGLRETDWYFLFPFFWGGSREDGGEDYFGFFPFWADLPDFLTYDRVLFAFWPLYVRTEKAGRVGHIVLWPLAGHGHGPDGYRWHKLLPLWSYAAWRSYERLWVLWPFFHQATENRDTDDPVHRIAVFPFFGRTHSDSREAGAWTVLWPFFQRAWIRGRFFRTVLFWPVFKLEEDRSETSPLFQWWLWPLVSRTVTDDQWTWSFLWPLVWLRHYVDPEGEMTQEWVVPFYWHVHRARRGGGDDDFVKVWPLWHRSDRRSVEGAPERGDWSIPSPWPYRQSNAAGVHEAYGWLWTLAEGRRRTPDDVSMRLTVDLYTTRTRGDVTQSSVPFLFNYEGDAEGGVLRLFQVFPIPWGGTR